jgi:hypothetical protein
VRVSDAERTILDALDSPKTFGDVRAALQLDEPALDRVDRRRLVAYPARGSRPSTRQRLGVLLERRGATARSLAPLARRIREAASLFSMLPDAPRTGPVNPRWRVVENDFGTSGHRVGNIVEAAQATWSHTDDGVDGWVSAEALAVLRAHRDSRSLASLRTRSHG